MYPRTVRVRSKTGAINEYIRVVEAYRDNGKVKQRVVADLGRKDLLITILPKLQRLLTGELRQGFSWPAVAVQAVSACNASAVASSAFWRSRRPV